MKSFAEKYGQMTVGEAIEANRQEKMAEEIARNFEDWENGLKDEDAVGREYAKIAKQFKILFNIFLVALAILAATIIWEVAKEVQK